MTTEPEVALSPITDADVESVAQFLHERLNRRLAASRWAAAMVPPWGGDFPNYGFMLTSGGDVVGANLAFYSVRMIHGEAEPFCNLGALCVREDARAHTFRLIRAILRQPGYHFTDLSPSGNVVDVDKRLGFRELDTATEVSINVPWALPRSVRVVSDLDEIEPLLTGKDLKIFHDHRRALAARHFVLVRGDERCYVIFRKDKRKKIRVFASILYIGNPRLYRAAAGQVASHLLLKHGAILSLTEHRVLESRPVWSRTLGRSRTKMYKSSRLRDADIDFLYSELTCVPW